MRAAVPFILGYFTADSWLSSKKVSFKDQEEALKKGMEKGKALEEANKKAEEAIQILQTKLVAT